MEGFCRGCLIKYDEPTDLIPYSEKNRRLFIYSTGLQVKKNDTFTFQLCKDCYLNMKESCRFKKMCRTSEKKFKNYIALKEDGDTVDFCMFLKNSDESLTLKLPLASGHSTPAHHKNKDDDNESTCTSIRNFMSDILQGEEVPDNEARIIKELFEEEADVLDDSLDSHWLQDDDNMSIATDFRVDFSFSPFSTPRSINNDHCYKPRRINDEDTDRSTNQYNNMPLLEVDECAMNIDHVADIPMDNIPTDIYTRNQENGLSIMNKDLFNKNKEIELGISLEKDKSNMLLNKAMNTEMHRTNHENNISVKNHDIFNKKELGISIENDDINVLINKNVNTDMCITNSDNNIAVEGQDLLIKNKEIELGIDFDKVNNVLLNKHFNILNEDQSIQIEETVQDDAIIVKDLLNIEENTQEFIGPTEIENDFYKMADEQKKDMIDESVISNELDYYINKVDMKRKNGESKKCSIDRNLENALLNEQNKEIALEHLIASPRVSINSGASTPTIRNIIFGNLEDTSKEENHENNIREEIITDVNKINSTEPLSTSLEPVSPLIENIKQEILHTSDKQEIDVNTENSVDDIITLIGKDNIQNFTNTKPIKTEDITDLIEDYVTNVYNNTDDLNNDEIDNLIATVIPKIEVQFETNEDERTDVFKKPIPPDEQYDLENNLCRLCDKKFNSGWALKIHFTKIHKVKIAPKKRVYHTLKCNECDKTFKGRANLIRHTKEAHSDMKMQHICKQCSVGFKTQYALNVHKRSHEDFVPKKDYDKHLCTFCGMYLTLSNHRLHQLKHQNIYKYKCDQCDKKFNRQWALTRHISTHTKQYEFICHFCAKTYSRMDVLKNHVQVHHLGNKFSCDECGSQFNTKLGIRKHLETSFCPNKDKNVSRESVNKRIKIIDDKLIKHTDDPLKISDYIVLKRMDDKSLHRTDAKPMNRSDDKKSTADDKPLERTNYKQMESTDKPIDKANVNFLNITEFTVKLEQLTDGESMDTDIFKKIVDSPISVTD